MAKEWYQGRMPRGRGYVAKSLRISLTAEDWERFDQIAAQSSWTRSHLASRFVLGYLREDESMERHHISLAARAAGLRAYDPEVH